MNEDWDVIAEAHGFRTEEEMFRELYIRRGYSVSRVARVLKVSTTTVNRRIGNLGIAKRPRGGANYLPRQKRTLHYADQRVVHYEPLEDVARMFQIHPSAVEQYRNA